MLAEDLKASQFIAGVGNPRRGGGRKNVHLFKLTYDCCAKVGDRGTNPGHDRIIVAQRFGSVVKVRFAFLQIDCKPERIKDLYLMTPFTGSFF